MLLSGFDILHVPQYFLPTFIVVFLDALHLVGHSVDHLLLSVDQIVVLPQIGAIQLLLILSQLHFVLLLFLKSDVGDLVIPYSCYL